jgi:hypothetical protein
MKKPSQSDDTWPAEAAEEVTARFESVPASRSETGLNEVYVVFNGTRIAMRGHPGTPQAGTWVSLEPGFSVAVDGAELVVIHDTTPTWIN